MPDSYSCTIEVKAQATQTFSTNADSSSRPSVTHDAFVFGPRVINSRSANPITVASHKLYTAIGTSGVEIDFTNLPDINGGTKDATGKQLYLIYVVNKTTNKKLLIQSASTNSYPIGTDNATANVSSTVAATLVKSQTGNSTQPTILTLTIPTTANAGYIKLPSPFNYPAVVTHNASATDVSAALVLSQIGIFAVNPQSQWSVVNPTPGTFVATTATNVDMPLPTIATQGLLNIASSSVVTSIPVYGLHPTLINLGTQGVVVDSTHKKIKLAAVADTVDAEVTLWFIDAVA